VDGEELANPLEEAGFATLRTDPDLPSGTDRIAQANRTLQREVVLNVQADEPLVSRGHVLALTTAIHKKGADLATLATPFLKQEDFTDPNQVKVVLDRSGFALMFSRSPIPYDREKGGQFNTLSLKHLGLYGYQKSFLEDFAKIPAGDLEDLEKLEQLRALENGKRIAVEIVAHGTIGVDTREDLDAIEFG